VLLSQLYGPRSGLWVTWMGIRLLHWKYTETKRLRKAGYDNLAGYYNHIPKSVDNIPVHTLPDYMRVRH
jgi:hypothetical protein